MLNTLSPTLIELLANRLSPQAGKSLVISRIREREILSRFARLMFMLMPQIS